MSKFKVLAVAAILVMATAGLAVAGDGCASKASAETASASCASKASAETASAGCASGAAAQTAGAGCASAAKTAGAGCAPGISAKTVQIETVRMPSGSMAVFYNGTNAETVAFLQSKAADGCSGFVCDMAKGMAADENVTTEIAATDTGVMILVTASEATSVDKYEEQYAAVVASMDEVEGE